MRRGERARLRGKTSIGAAMSDFHAKRHVRHNADQMFDLVADVERYSRFVPNCERNAVVSRKKCGDNEILITDMTVAYRIFRQTVRSRVTLDRSNGRILVESIDGPLRLLRVLWTFRSTGAASSEVTFDLAYEFASRTLAMLLGSLFDALFSRFVQAFEHRADSVYARGAQPSPADATVTRVPRPVAPSRHPGQRGQPRTFARALDLSQ
jgi:coenzyme Q-binding protein COQ10